MLTYNNTAREAGGLKKYVTRRGLDLEIWVQRLRQNNPRLISKPCPAGVFVCFGFWCSGACESNETQVCVWGGFFFFFSIKGPFWTAPERCGTDGGDVDIEYHQPLRLTGTYERSHGGSKQRRPPCVNQGGGGLRCWVAQDVCVCGGVFLPEFQPKPRPHFSNSSAMQPQRPNESPCRDKNLLGLRGYRQHLHLQLSIVQLGLQ